MKKLFKISFVFIALCLIIGVGLLCGNKYYKANIEVGKQMDSYKGVAVFYNGIDYSENHGEHYSQDGYYYGYKWQCVEYVKRFYYIAKGHKMPNIYGNAKDFFDPSVQHGALNKSRDLIQYKNGENEKPCADDLLVFNDTTYGHVVIITEVGKDFIEVIQQNMGLESRGKFELQYKQGKYFIGGKRIPAGWLRKS